MEARGNQIWFLRKHEDGRVFGPLRFDQLRRWAATAQIAPHDKLSHDEQTWLKAPMFPELEMDWLVEVTSESFYGPTTLGAVREFIRLGEINNQTFVINSRDGLRRQISELSEFLREPNELEEDLLEDDRTSADDAPPATRMATNLHDRIRELEQSLGEERRALQRCEKRYLALETRYQQLQRSAGSPPTRLS